MEWKFLVYLMLTVCAKLVQPRNFTCPIRYKDGSCTITDVVPQDNSIQLFYSTNYPRSHNVANLKILNSTLDDVPVISSSYFLMSLSCFRCGLNGLTESSLTPYGNLKALEIPYGSFSYLPKNLFSPLRSLITLNVSHGAINEIDDDAFFNLETLEILDLTHNNISKVTAKMFAPLASIWQLILSHNHIEILDDGLFINNTKLYSLHLDNNKIYKINGQLFDPKCVVYNVLLSNNELTTINTQNMQFVNANNNKIKELTISNTVNFLIADHNDIQSVTCDEIGTQMNILSLENNSLTDLGCIGSFTQLFLLNLNYNDLRNLNQSSFAALTELKSLNLKSANIGKLEDGIFTHQTKLVNLDISYNQIGNIALDKLLATRDLRALYIDGNNVTEFSYNGLHTTFPSLKMIGIGDNDFNCTFLAEAINHLNSYNISVVVSSGNNVTNASNIHGIGCRSVRKAKIVK